MAHGTRPEADAGQGTLTDREEWPWPHIGPRSSRVHRRTSAILWELELGSWELTQIKRVNDPALHRHPAPFGSWALEVGS